MPRTVVLIVLVVLASSAAGLIVLRQEEQRPVLEIPEEALDIGTVWVDHDMRWTLPFVNRGSRPVSVRKLRTSCRCITASPESFALVAHDTRKVALRLDLSPALGQEEDEQGRRWTPRQWSFSVTVIAQMLKQTPSPWFLKGHVRSPFVLSATKITLPPGSVVSSPASRAPVVQTDAASAAPLIVRAVMPVERLEATCSTAIATAELSPTPDATDPDSYCLRVVPVGSVEPGRYRFDTIVRAILADDRSGSVRIPTAIAVVGDIEISPAAVHLGYIGMGEPASADVAVVSRLGKAFAISKIETNSALTVEQVTPNQRDTRHQLRVSVTPSAAGHGDHAVTMNIIYSESNATAKETFSVLWDAKNGEPGGADRTKGGKQPR